EPARARGRRSQVLGRLGNWGVVRAHPQHLATEADRERHLARERPLGAAGAGRQLEDAGGPSVTHLLVDLVGRVLLLGNQALRTAFSEDTPENLQNGDYIDIASAVLDIGAAALAIAVVVALTRRQQARASALATITPVVAPQSDSF